MNLPTFLLSSACCAALLALAGDANAERTGPPTCSVPKASNIKNCPATFDVVKLPNGPVEVIYYNDPIAPFAQCLPRRNGMTCEAWPQEYDTVGYLTYQWSIRVGGVLTNYPTSTNPVRMINCAPLQGVEATVTITNGSYSASTSMSYGCGNQIQ